MVCELGASDKQGLLGALTGGLSATAGGIAAAIQAIGPARQIPAKPKIPGSVKDTTALAISSNTPAISGIKLLPTPCSIFRYTKITFKNGKNIAQILK